MAQHIEAKRKLNWWSIGLWTAQIVLAVLYVMTGSMKLMMPPELLAAKGMAYATAIPVGLLRFVGLLEILGSLGLILPAALRILPYFTPLAAVGLSLLQIAAILLHGSRGELAMMLPVNALLLAIALFIAWGRARKAPIAPR